MFAGLVLLRINLIVVAARADADRKVYFVKVRELFITQARKHSKAIVKEGNLLQAAGQNYIFHTRHLKENLPYHINAVLDNRFRRAEKRSGDLAIGGKERLNPYQAVIDCGLIRFLKRLRNGIPAQRLQDFNEILMRLDRLRSRNYIAFNLNLRDFALFDADIFRDDLRSFALDDRIS